MDSDFLESNPLNMCNTAALVVWTTQESLIIQTLPVEGIFFWTENHQMATRMNLFYHFLKFVFDLHSDFLKKMS